ncbi:RNase adapter RapZ [Thiohalophilus sp.]|uniref:RNase adapter RapZ n=1 Tax=Thiohalophilus sp. TaxID=3028392 RepID=UPI0039750503
MKLLIISGLSGSGKSVALHVLEDLNYYCIDNLPIGMLPSLADEIVQANQHHEQWFAVGIDARNLPGELVSFPRALQVLDDAGIQCEIFFLEADEVTLLKRFSETRRKHPLSNDEVPLNEAILQEHQLLEPIFSRAGLRIDTSMTNIHQLRDIIRNRVDNAASPQLSIQFQSFGFKHGVPVDADFVFDIRCIPNPHWVTELRHLTGQDQAVADYLEQHDLVHDMYNDIRQFVEKWIGCFESDNRNYMTVAIGCTGGYHRSVYIVEKLANYFHSQRDGILVRHRELT